MFSGDMDIFFLKKEQNHNFLNKSPRSKGEVAKFSENVQKSSLRYKLVHNRLIEKFRVKNDKIVILRFAS